MSTDCPVDGEMVYVYEVTHPSLGVRPFRYTWNSQHSHWEFEARERMLDGSFQWHLVFSTPNPRAPSQIVDRRDNFRFFSAYEEALRAARQQAHAVVERTQEQLARAQECVAKLDSAPEHEPPEWRQV